MLGEQWLFEFSLFARQRIFEHVRRYFCLNWLLQLKILNILTGQEQVMTELTLVWQLNMTGHGPKLFLALYFQQIHQFSQSNQKSVSTSKWWSVLYGLSGLCIHSSLPNADI